MRNTMRYLALAATVGGLLSAPCATAIMARQASPHSDIVDWRTGRKAATFTLNCSMSSAAQELSQSVGSDVGFTRRSPLVARSSFNPFNEHVSRRW